MWLLRGNPITKVNTSIASEIQCAHNGAGGEKELFPKCDIGFPTDDATVADSSPLYDPMIGST